MQIMMLQTKNQHSKTQPKQKSMTWHTTSNQNLKSKNNLNNLQNSYHLKPFWEDTEKKHLILMKKHQHCGIVCLKVWPKSKKLKKSFLIFLLLHAREEPEFTKWLHLTRFKKRPNLWILKSSSISAITSRLMILLEGNFLSMSSNFMLSTDST